MDVERSSCFLVLEMCADQSSTAGYVDYVYSPALFPAFVRLNVSLDQRCRNVRTLTTWPGIGIHEHAHHNARLVPQLVGMIRLVTRAPLLFLHRSDIRTIWWNVWSAA